MIKARDVDLSDMDERTLKQLQKRIDKQIDNIKKYNFQVDRISCKYETNGQYILCLGVDQYRGCHLSIANKEIYRSNDINEILTYIKSLKESLLKAEDILTNAKANKM